jgi:hypothetical protein
MDLLMFLYNYTHKITSSTLQLFSWLLISLRLPASQLRLNASRVTLLGNTMNLEDFLEFCLSNSESESLIYFLVSGSHFHLLSCLSLSYVATDGQSVSLSWNKATFRVLRPEFSVRQLRVCWCGSLFLTRGRVFRLQFLLVLASAVILGSESREARDQILMSQIRHFPFLSPPTTRRATVEVFDTSGNSSCFITFGRPRTEQLIRGVTICLRTRCLGKVPEPLPSKMGSSLSSSVIPAVRRCLPSRCLAMDAWLLL